MTAPRPQTREKVRGAATIASLGVIALLGGGCASNSALTVSPASSPPAPSDSAASATAVPPPSSASPASPAPADVDCPSVEDTSAAIVSVVHDVGEVIGTATDPTAILAELPALQSTLASLVPSCAPKAEATMWLLDAALAQLREGYQTGRDRTSVAADRALLLTTRIAGDAFFEALAVDPAVWQDVPRKARLACADLDKTGTSLSTSVLELSHLVGSSNDPSSYLTTVSGLTSAITDLAPTCDPKASQASDALVSAVQQLATDFKPGTETATIDADKTALNQVRSAGTSLYRLMGMNAAGWENVPAEAR